MEEEEEDRFKPVFKHFKSWSKPSSLLESEMLSSRSSMRRLEVKTCFSTSKLDSLHLRPSSEWLAQDLSDSVSGLKVVHNVFRDHGHAMWALKCLKDYTAKPYRSNLDVVHHKSRIASSDSWFKLAAVNSKLCDRLRWSTLGVHHNWDTKHYDFTDTSSFPCELNELCNCILTNVGDVENNEFKAQAAIVNFYPMKSTLSPHTDHSEPNQQAPLISISFGQSAVFLIGGSTRSIAPTALLLKSGDVVVMSGEARRAFHAVPKIVHTTEAPWQDETGANGAGEDEGLEAEMKFVESYLNSHRINVNVRQVH